MKVIAYLSSFLILIVALLHAGFLVLEMFLWEQPLGLKIFSMTPEDAKVSATLAKNQGLYNGFLTAGLLWALLKDYFEGKILFLLFVIVAGIYGAITVGPTVLFVQALTLTLTVEIAMRMSDVTFMVVVVVRDKLARRWLTR